MKRFTLALAALAALTLTQCTTVKTFKEAALVTVKLTNLSGTGGGTGFPISCRPLGDGTFRILLLTAAHVTAGSIEGWDAVIANDRWLGYVSFIEKHESLDASVVEVISAQPIHCISLREHAASVGERVYAIGYPMVRNRVISDGYVGDRNVCSTPIYPGNSGGPLVDSNGECVGIIVAVGVHNRGNHYQLICHDAVFVPVVDLLDWLTTLM